MGNEALNERHQSRAYKYADELQKTGKPKKVTFKAGDVAFFPYWPDFTKKDGIKGRPVLILKTERGHATVIEITTAKPRPQFPGEIVLNTYEKFGLDKPSTLRISQQADVLIRDFVYKVGEFDKDTFDYVLEEYADIKKSSISLKSYRPGENPKRVKPKTEGMSVGSGEKSKAISDFIEDLYDLRKESIAKDGEYGIGNLVFKEFRNRGYLDKLKDMKNEERSKELSLEKLSKNSKGDKTEMKEPKLFEKTGDADLDETLPESFEGKIDFLAADEEEAIEGYDKVILALSDEKYENVRKQLEIIRDEEVAHKEFLENVKEDLEAVYVDPSEAEEGDIVDLGEPKESKEVVSEGKTKAQRHNDEMDRIFGYAKNVNLAMKKFLIANGVSKEEAEKLYQGTGLHGSPLMQKLIDMGLKDEFFSKIGKDGNLKESKAREHRIFRKRLSEAIEGVPYDTKSGLEALAKEVIEKNKAEGKDDAGGTYSYVDGKLIPADLKSGYQVSFFRPEIKDDDIKAWLPKLDFLGEVYLGLFENTQEISYHVMDLKKALKIAKFFNQKCIYDIAAKKCIANPDYDASKKIDYKSLDVNEIK